MDYDRNENAEEDDDPDVNPPIVSPAPPGDPDDPDEAPLEFCYEVNILRFGSGVVFGTPDAGPVCGAEDGVSLCRTVSETADSGWADIDLSFITEDEDDGLDDLERHQDRHGLVGLPVIGFAAYEFENGFLGEPGASVLANYGGLFGHKGSVRQITCDDDIHDDDGGCLD